MFGGKSPITAAFAGRQPATIGVAAGPGFVPWLMCRAATHRWAIPVEHVIETMRVLPLEAVSGAPRYVCGLAIIRGRPVAVVDAGLLVFDRPTAPNRLVCVRAGHRTVALVAEAVVGIRSCRHDSFDRLPPLLRDAAADAITAIGTMDAELLFLLHTARLVPEDLFDRLDIERVDA